MTGSTRIALDVVTAAAMCLADHGNLDLVVAERLGRHLGLDGVLVLRLSPGAGPRVSAHWPAPDPDELLVRHLQVAAARVAAEAAHGTPCPTGRWTNRSILYAALGLASPVREAGRPRVLALVRPVPFGPDDLAVWTVAEPPLAALFHRADRDEQVADPPASAPDPSGGGGITDRERAVLELLAQGLTAMAIATRLDVSPRTVHRHLDNAYRKLGVHDRMLAVGAARRHGLISVPNVANSRSPF